MIDRNTFVRVMRVFGDRIGRPLEPETQAVYYATLGEELSTDTFQRAAVLVFKTHGYNTWPAPQAFLDADKLLRHDRDAEIHQTERLLSAQRALPAPKSEALEAFAVAWRRELAHCAPAAVRAQQLGAAAVNGADPWLTDERRGEPGAGDRRDPVTRAGDADADREVA